MIWQKLRILMIVAFRMFRVRPRVDFLSDTSALLRVGHRSPPGPEFSTSLSRPLQSQRLPAGGPCCLMTSPLLRDADPLPSGRGRFALSQTGSRRDQGTRRSRGKTAIPTDHRPFSIFFIHPNMSVCTLSPKEFSDIIVSLKEDTGSCDPIFPLTVEERYDYKTLVEGYSDRTLEDYRIELVGQFVNRLYIANHLSFAYMYESQLPQLTIPMIEFPKGEMLGFRELAGLLDHLHYNLYTNAGNSFVSKKDEEKLDSVIVRYLRR